MPPRKPPNVKEPFFPPHKAIALLRQQLEALQEFKGRRHSEVGTKEEEWQHLTTKIIEQSFDSSSANSLNFRYALKSGPSPKMVPFGGYSVDVSQPRFEARIKAVESQLNALIRELELYLPESEIKGAYAPGDEYAFYKDLKTIIEGGKVSLFIIDNYLDVQLFDLYVERAPAAMDVRILTDQLRGNVQAVAEKFAKRGHFELRTSKDAHDRQVFVDDRGWVIGQSIKDAAQRKPTYMIELDHPATLRNIYEDIWTKAATIVKG